MKAPTVATPRRQKSEGYAAPPIQAMSELPRAWHPEEARHLQWQTHVTGSLFQQRDREHSIGAKARPDLAFRRAVAA